MAQEKFFRLLSVAVLGAIALAFVPESGPDSDTMALSSPPSMSIESEVQSLREVEDINQGGFKPYVAGDVSPIAGSDTSSPVVSN